ncbi:hypothetical protein ON010_g3020 [Phytophthora cinnamomi]|nr:hypothetical protein ON010_g3020 [Phytophthora cinnamomi]
MQDKEERSSPPTGTKGEDEQLHGRSDGSGERVHTQEGSSCCMSTCYGYEAQGWAYRSAQAAANNKSKVSCQSDRVCLSATGILWNEVEVIQGVTADYYKVWIWAMEYMKSKGWINLDPGPVWINLDPGPVWIWSYAVDLQLWPGGSNQGKRKEDLNLLWTSQDLPSSPGSRNYIGPIRRREVSGTRSSVGNYRAERGSAGQTCEDKERCHNTPKATLRPDPDPGRQIQVQGYWICNKRENSEDFRTAPPGTPRLSTAWTLRKTPDEQDPALPTGTQGEKFSTDHGSSGDPLR